MASKNSQDFACGQVLFSLKTSKLNYLVNETPYSVYITIRKKFMRDNRSVNLLLVENATILQKMSGSTKYTYAKFI